MAYTPDNLHCAMATGGPLGFSLWTYDTTDAVGDIDAVDYFAGEKVRGMEVGDLIMVRVWTTSVPATTAAKNAANPADAAWFMVRSRDADGNCTVAAETAIVVAAGA